MNTKKRYTRQNFYGVASLFILSAILISTWISGCNQNPEQTIAFTNVNLIPMTSETVIEDQTVLVKGSEIIDIGGANELKIPRGAQVIDEKGAYLMPGLADMHAHTRISTGQWAQPWEDPRVWPVHPLNLYLANGVTTIRDLSAMDETGNYPLQLRDEIRAGKRVGPTIYTAGETLFASPLGNPEELVRQNHELGYDLLKLYSYLSVEDFQTAMRTAKKLSIYTAGHIPYAVGLEGVLAEGMDEITHTGELVWEFFEFDRCSQLSPQEWGAYLFQAVLQNIDLNLSTPLAEFEIENQSILEKIAKQLRTAGVLIAQHRKVLFSKGYGLADRTLGIPITPQTRFHLGSITKQFTAMVILILQKQGKLSVQDPICNFIDGCPKEWQNITIHHLLTHSSRLSSQLSDQLYRKIEAATSDPTSPAEGAQYLGLTSPWVLDTQPGEHYAYNNFGYILLAHIIEGVSGQSYRDFLNQTIFTSLRMCNSGYQDIASGVAKLYFDHADTTGV